MDIRRKVAPIVTIGGIGLFLGLACESARAQAAQSEAKDRPVVAPEQAQSKTKVQAKAAAAVEVEEMVVTARRRAELISEAPVVVTAVSGEQLAEKGIYSATAVAQLVPNVYIAPSILLDQMFVRGVGAAGANIGLEQSVGLFVDGVYYAKGKWISSAYFDLDQAQILSGPQGVYFGKNTVAGALDITTKSPGKELEGFAKAGYEFWAKERYGEAGLSVPITDKLGVRVAGRATQMDGWANGSGKDQPGIQDMVGRVTVAYNPLPDLDATYKLQYNKYKDNGPPSTITLLECPPGGPSPIAGYGVTGEAPCKRGFDTSNITTTRFGPAFTTISSYTNALNMHWRQSFGTLTSITGFNHNKLETRGEYTATNFDAVDDEYGQLNRAFSQELRYLTSFDFPLNVLGGVYYQYTHFVGYNRFNVLPPAIQGADWVRDRRNDQAGDSLSGFGEVQWQIIPSLELDVGGRYTRDTKHSTIENLLNPGLIAPLAAAFPPGKRLEARQTFTDFSPQAILTWKPRDRFMAYAKYATGVLSGGFNHDANLLANTQLADMLFGSEKVKGGEAGTKFSLFDRRVQLNATGYYYRYTDLQVNVFNPFSLAFTINNAAEAEVMGAEFSGGWQIGQGLSFLGTLAYNRSRYVDYIGGCRANHPEKCTYPLPTVPGQPQSYGEDFGGAALDFAPDWAGRVEVDYTHGFDTPWTMLPGSGHVEMTSSVGLNWSTPYIVTQVLDEPSHQLLDANVAWRLGPWVAGVSGRNLLHQVVCGFSGGRPASTASPSEITCLVQRGREVHVELTYNF